jgi:hypothetical protein
MLFIDTVAIEQVAQRARFRSKINIVHALGVTISFVVLDAGKKRLPDVFFHQRSSIKSLKVWFHMGYRG